MGLPAEDIRNDHLGSIAKSLEVIAKNLQMLAHPPVMVSAGGEVSPHKPGGVTYVQDSHSAAHIKK